MHRVVYKNDTSKKELELAKQDLWKMARDIVPVDYRGRLNMEVHDMGAFMYIILSYRGV